MKNYLSSDESKTLWQKIMIEINQLPSLPEVIVRLIKELDNKETNPEILEKIIINDATLSAKVLCIANSAYYAQSQKVNTISKAIVLLGINTIRNLVMVLSTSNALNRSFKGYGLEKGELYSHSIATAVGAGYIAKHTMTVEKEKIFIAGLLHDIGKMLLSPYLMDYIDTIKEITVKEDKPFNIVEKEIFGFNHCELGAELAIKWHLPKIVIEANKYHHNPSECPADDLPIIEYIHLADYIAYLSKYGLGIDGNNYKVIFDIFDKYKISDERKINLMKAVKNEMNELLKSITVV